MGSGKTYRTNAGFKRRTDENEIRKDPKRGVGNKKYNTNDITSAVVKETKVSFSFPSVQSKQSQNGQNEEFRATPIFFSELILLSRTMKSTFS